MKTVILHGELGARFGRRHRLEVRTAAEAVRALCANFADFAKFVSGSEQRGVGYKVFNQREPVRELNELHHPAGRVISIVPVLMGAGNGWGKIIVGTVLIVVGVFTGQPWLVNLGTTVALSGVAQLMAPTPKALSPAERAENMPSYVFNGPVNTTAQGHPVPVGYGRMIVGSAVISAGLCAEELPLSGVDPLAIIGAMGKS